MAHSGLRARGYVSAGFFRFRFRSRQPPQVSHTPTFPEKQRQAHYADRAKSNQPGQYGRGSRRPFLDPEDRRVYQVRRYLRSSGPTWKLDRGTDHGERHD
jgi:hypothetical protein